MSRHDGFPLSGPVRAPAGDDDGRTVIMPPPGGRRRGGAAAGAPPPGMPDLDPPPPAPPAARPPATAGDLASDNLEGLEGVGENPLLRAAAPVLALIAQLRTVADVADVPALRQRLIATIDGFESRLRSGGVEPETIVRAKYALCSLIDEAVLSTPWGFRSSWSTESLNVTYFRDRIAGERFYAYLREALDYPAGHLDLLELCYVCLSLGYTGRYGVQKDGVERRGAVRQEVYRVILQYRGEPVNDLSPRWRGVVDRRPRLSRYLAWWVVPVIAATVGLLSYVGLSYALNEESDRVYSRVARLDTPTVLPPPTALPEVDLPPPKVDLPPAETAVTLSDDLRLTLQPEIDENLLAVEDTGETVRIVLYNRGLFPSGIATVGERFEAIIRKIGLVLAQDDPPGPYLVSGHTDNVPIRTVRFPSNFHLSQARAEAVAALLAPHLTDPAVITVEGRADSQPLAPNDTAEGRALNRRVEIEVPDAAGSARAQAPRRGG